MRTQADYATILCSLIQGFVVANSYIVIHISQSNCGEANPRYSQEYAAIVKIHHSWNFKSRPIQFKFQILFGNLVLFKKRNLTVRDLAFRHALN